MGEDLGPDPPQCVQGCSGLGMLSFTGLDQPAAENQKAHMREKLSNGAGKAVYSRPKVIVQPCHRADRAGARLPSLLTTRAGEGSTQMALVCLIHNLLKPFRHRRARASRLHPKPPLARYNQQAGARDSGRRWQAERPRPTACPSA